MNDPTSLAALFANADEVGDCLEWRGPYGTGRGKVTPIVRRYIDGRSENLSVTRLVWEQTEGPIPEGRIVYRHCCNHRCIKCLCAGKRGDVQRHRAKLGLCNHSPAAVAALTRSARERAHTKYTIEQARAVRALVAQGLPDCEVSRLTGRARARGGRHQARQGLARDCSRHERVFVGCGWRWPVTA